MGKSPPSILAMILSIVNNLAMLFVVAAIEMGLAMALLVYVGLWEVWDYHQVLALAVIMVGRPWDPYACARTLNTASAAFDEEES